MLRTPAMLPLTATLALTAALALTPVAAHAAGEAHPTGIAQSSAAVKSYKNCTAMHKAYPHGVGKKGAKDKVSGKAKPVTNFKVSTTVYTQNKKLDRDKDGIACEAH